MLSLGGQPLRKDTEKCTTNDETMDAAENRKLLTILLPCHMPEQGVAFRSVRKTPPLRFYSVIYQLSVPKTPLSVLK